MDLNKAMIIGRLTRDPETRTIPSGSNVCSFSVATNLMWKDASGQRQEKVEYHNIVTWRKLADICSQYLSKGKKVYLEGRIQTRDWVGQDGVKRYRTEIVAENMIMLDSRGASQPVNSGNFANQNPVQTQAQTQSFARPVNQSESFGAVSKPVSENLPSISLEEPANSVAQAQPSENVMPQAMPSPVATEVNKDEEIKVEDIPF
ncbi:MAG: single-stranded DNA-binding protein [Patescibacteria group bacterium]|jgi:single-strand DNA-binding protein